MTRFAFTTSLLLQITSMVRINGKWQVGSVVLLHPAY